MGGSLYNKIPLGRRRVTIRAWKLGVCIGSIALLGATLFVLMSSK